MPHDSTTCTGYFGEFCPTSLDRVVVYLTPAGTAAGLFFAGVFLTLLIGLVVFLILRAKGYRCCERPVAKSL